MATRCMGSTCAWLSFCERPFDRGLIQVPDNQHAVPLRGMTRGVFLAGGDAAAKLGSGAGHCGFPLEAVEAGAYDFATQP